MTVEEIAIKIQYVQQPTPHSCVHACLSMVTGLPVNDLIDRFSDSGLSSAIEATVLTEMGILPISLPITIATPFLNGNVFFLTVPSLNVLGNQHLVVVEADGDGDLIVYDPNKDKEDYSWYPPDALQPSIETIKAGKVLRGFSNITLLRPLSEHRGSAERGKLYMRRAHIEGTEA